MMPLTQFKISELATQWTMADQMTSALNSTGCALSLWNRERDLVETFVDYNRDCLAKTDPPGTTYLLKDNPVTRRVLETGQPIVIRRDDPNADQAELSKMKRQDIQVLLMLPLIARERVIGMMELVDDTKAREYTPGQIRLAESLASQAAIAVENAKLFEEVEERRVYLEVVLGAAPDAIATLDTHHRIVEWNSGAEQLFGYSREEVIGLNIDHLVTNPDVFVEAAGFTQIIMCGKGLPPTKTVRYRKDGSPVDVIVAGSPILIDDELIGAVSVYTDITKSKRAEEALRYRVEFEGLISALSTHFVNLASDEIDSGINHALQTIGKFAGVDRSYVFLFSDDGTKMDNIHEWCAGEMKPQIDNLKGLPIEVFPWWMEQLKRFEHIHIPRVADLPPVAGAEKEILQAQNIQSLIVVPMTYSGSLIGFLGFDSVLEEKSWPEDMIALLRLVGELLANALKRKLAEEALRDAHSALEIRIHERTAALARANKALRIEIAERKKAEETIKHMAYRDPLTSLPNRRLFTDRLTMALTHSQRNQQKLAVMLLDMDHFKEVNDTLGHGEGDRLLQVVGERLTRLLRKGDTVARMGGDEFMLLLPEITGEKSAVKVAANILKALRDTFVFDGHEIHATASIGIAIYPDDGGDGNILVKRADNAMYLAKNQGRNNYQRYTSAIRAKSQA